MRIPLGILFVAVFALTGCATMIGHGRPWPKNTTSFVPKTSFHTSEPAVFHGVLQAFTDNHVVPASANTTTGVIVSHWIPGPNMMSYAALSYIGPEKTRYRFMVTVVPSGAGFVKVRVKTNIQEGGVSLVSWSSITASHPKTSKQLTSWMLANIDRAMGVS